MGKGTYAGVSVSWPFHLTDIQSTCNINLENAHPGKCDCIQTENTLMPQATLLTGKHSCKGSLPVDIYLLLFWKIK